MTSERKWHSNRRNAKFSQGPKSAMGRARSRRNALKSGLYAKTTLLPFEDAKAYAKLRVAIFAEFGPKGAIEEGLVEFIIAELWRLNRFALIENAFLEQTRLALSSRPVGSMPTATWSAIQCGQDDKAAADIGECSPRRSRHGNSSEVLFKFCGAATLLDAFVCRVSQTPMEDVARQRRCSNRELLRHIAALEALQARRQAINTS